MKFQSFLNFTNFTKKIIEIIKMFLHFWFFTCCPYSFYFWTSLFIKRSYVSVHSYSHYVISFKHVNFGKHVWILRQIFFKKNHAHFKILSWDEVFTCLFFLFFIPGWNFVSVFLTGMSSSRDEISSRQKRVNSKRYLTIDRDDFIPEWNFIAAKTCKQ